MNRIIEILILIIISAYYLSFPISMKYDIYMMSSNLEEIAYLFYIILWIVPATLIFIRKKTILYIPLVIFYTIFSIVSTNLISNHYLELEIKYKEYKTNN